mmetsp:Transcript_48066/g.71242  ORF Transcript_48066/g.71242 Transcript_48066/m.71242 type:complete len:133 (+) Transcript_48066:85-483(+)
MISSKTFLFLVGLSILPYPSSSFSPVSTVKHLPSSPFGLAHHLRSKISSLQMAKVGVYFGTSTGSTETVAEMIVSEFGGDVAAGPFDIDTLRGEVAKSFGNHDAIVVGTPTWNTGADTERSGTGWDEICEQS